ncbi:hypothetical protein ADK44_17760, partial [Streptomyces rimosus subsp. rimosus]
RYVALALVLLTGPEVLAMDPVGEVLSARQVLGRTSRECARRHAVLVEAVRDGCAGPVEGLRAEPVELAGKVGMRALVERGALPAMPLEQLGDGELRYVALALVLLTGPEVLAMDPVGEVLSARQVLG